MRLRTRVNFFNLSKRRKRSFHWMGKRWRGLCRCGKVVYNTWMGHRILDGIGVHHFCNPLEAPGRAVQLTLDIHPIPCYTLST